MTQSANLYKRHRFPPAIIQYAAWLYHRFNLSHRDIEDLLAERGIEVSYELVRPWCGKFWLRRHVLHRRSIHHHYRSALLPVASSGSRR